MNVILIVVLLLTAIFFATSIVAITMMQEHLPKPFSYSSLLGLGAVATFLTIMSAIVFYLELNDLQKRVKAPVQYELVHEQFYKKIN